MFYKVLVSGKKFHGIDSLTYKYSEPLVLGQLVEVDVKGVNSKAVVCAEETSKPTFKVSEITKVLPFVLPAESIELINWMRDYYPGPLGPLLDMFVPVGRINDSAPEAPKQQVQDKNSEALPVLNSGQLEALEILNSNAKKPALLHGDTGTGKTRIYIERSLQVLESGQSAMILTPEIGLTEPLKERFEHAFPKQQIVVIHSAKSAKHRQNTWKTIASSDKPLVIIGTRSALFAPVKNLGLIVMDEAHDTAYKQEQQPYYQATRVAAKLASLHESQLILGSATPLISDYYAFQQKKLPIIRLKDIARKSSYKTGLKIVDLGDKSLFTKSKSISTELVNAIASAINNNEQSMLFLNRRGSARLVLCDDCGWQAKCPNCDVALVYHADKHKMMCHSCGHSQSVPNTCPDCGSNNLIYTVAGTKSVEEELRRYFPDATIHRFDRDTSADQRIGRIFSTVESGKVDILIGTQGIVKGFDLPKLSVVGVIHADSGLQIADYTAAEHTFQLVSQVTGRLGRGYRDGTIFLQTYSPDSQLLRWALSKGYEEFYKTELEHRQKYIFPPACYLLKITAKRASAQSSSQALLKLVPAINSVGGVQILGPAPCYPEKVAGKYKWQIVLKSKDRKKLVQLVLTLPKNYSYDLDPNSLL